MACLTFSFAIKRVSICDPVAHLLRGTDYLPPPDIRLETLCIVCLSGPATEQHFCGAITDNSDCVDVAMAQRYLSRSGCDALTLSAELAWLRDSADKLVRTPWASERIRLISDALLRHGTLSGAEIMALAPTAPTAAWIT